MTNFIDDLRSGVRQIVKHRGFSTIVIVTLALGIGATTTFFSILNALVLRPLPYVDPDRLVSVNASDPARGRTARLSYQAFTALTSKGAGLQGAVAYASRDYNAAGSGFAERSHATEVSGDLFLLLGAPVGVGRAFVAEDFRPGRPVAVIGHGFWQRHYGADPAALGSTLVLDGAPYEVIGVAPERFGFPHDTDLWLPFDSRPGHLDARGVDVVARLHDSLTLQQVKAALTATDVEAASGTDSGGTAWRAQGVSLRESMRLSKQRNMVAVVLTATGLVLLIACANLAGLLTAHLSGRRQEIAVRAALGARRSRIAVLLLTESVLLALAGGALGTVMAQWGIDLFAATLGRPEGAGWLDFSIDGRVLLFVLNASLVTALLFGLGPAIVATRVDLRAVLQEDVRATGTAVRARRLRRVLVTAQIAASLGLIAAASSIVASSIGLGRVDAGFDRNQIVVLHTTLSGAGYEAASPRVAFVRSALDRLAAIPGVSAATATSHVPLADRDLPYAGVRLEGFDPDSSRAFASLRFAASSYLRAMRIPVRRGRPFSEQEAMDLRAPVVLINESMARRYWPGVDPLGRRLQLSGFTGPDAWFTVVGVVADVAQRNPGDAPGNQIYLPLAHAREISFVLRAADTRAIVPATRRAIAEIDAQLPVTARTMDDVYAWYVQDRRGQGLVLGSLGVVALLLASLGVFGVVALMVAEQRREIAIRMALGSSSGSVGRLVLGGGLRLALLGIGAGLPLAIGMTTMLSSIFFGVRPFDLRVFAGAAAVLIVTAVFASWWPARRAMTMDPMAVLRS